MRYHTSIGENIEKKFVFSWRESLDTKSRSHKINDKKLCIKMKKLIFAWLKIPEMKLKGKQHTRIKYICIVYIYTKWLIFIRYIEL